MIRRPNLCLVKSIRWASFVALLCVLSVVGALAGCTKDTTEVIAEPAPTATDTPTPTAAPDTPPATTEPAATPVPVPMSTVNVYWAWTIDSVPGGTPERLGAGSRTVSGTSTLRAALEALLAGPDDVESSIAMGTQIPAGTELLDVTISGDGIATVDLSSAFEESGGTLGETVRTAQVVFTATQFESVERVRFRIDGVDREALGSHGLDVSDGLGRDDFADVRPAIMVESPSPGATVGPSFAVRGEANTFEATVEWRVLDAAGSIVAQGFTTATAGSGTWGTFDTVIDVPSGLSGQARLQVFESSAKDGRQTNIVEYPISF